MTTTTQTQTNPGGWHTVAMSGRSARTGIVRSWRIRYRTQRHICHGQTWGQADAEHVPFYIDGTEGTPRPYVSQCGNCGISRSWRFAATEEN